MTQSLSLFILTFNCAKALLDVNSFSSNVLSPLKLSRPPDLIVLSLQEVAPTPYAFIGGSLLTPYIRRFHDAIANYPVYEDFGNDTSSYVPVVIHNIGTTCLIVYTKNPSAVRDIETTGVGTGYWNMGNKGAAGARLTYNNTELTFAALHLSAMEWNLNKRNQNWEKIVKGLIFSSSISNKIGDNIPLLSSVSKNASMYKASSHLFIAGDLNYRTSQLSPAPQDYLTAFPQPDMSPDNEHHFLNLLKSDQLNQARRAGQTCHGLSEANITFPPTYKHKINKEIASNYNNQTEKWNWAPNRWPSWCDRILYLDLPKWLTSKYPDVQIKTLRYDSLPLLPNSDHQPVALAVEIPMIQIPEPDHDEVSDDPRIILPFDIDISSKNRRENVRKLELVSGIILLLTTTAEGGCLLAVFVSAMALGFFIKSKGLEIDKFKIKW
ncbi:Type II inositol polyphosphate 5-phosphatase 15 [Erysiphe necator]|uniref:Putative inositol 5-phosphatase n=1 Tax=Uncinula necator TaxID=52586 RepID=A0A0B1P0F9_UNCNE|nr:Type II inositol polyphosphate 5-phosphatase 15 [Erysiphe necator]KHJ30381.1 putative inositol 5-phosphatase [Erysiphe necator]